MNTLNKRLQRTRLSGHLLKGDAKVDRDCSPLKRIYKASQEKKENSSPRGAEWVLFFYLTAPSSVFQKRTGLCNRTL